MPIGIGAVYGIAFLVAMVAIGAGLTWVGLQDVGVVGETAGADAEAAD